MTVRRCAIFALANELSNDGRRLPLVIDATDEL
jgi:hypothetical protein